MGLNVLRLPPEYVEYYGMRSSHKMLPWMEKLSSFIQPHSLIQNLWTPATLRAQQHCPEQTDPTLLKFTLPRRNRFRNSCTERRNINNVKVTLYSGKSRNTVNTPSHKVQEKCLSESKFKDLPHSIDLSSTDSHGIFLRDATISDKRKYKG